jgi:hypothetical protein
VPASGSVFPIGIDQVTCIAVDAAGNGASASFRVTVLGAPEQLGNLIEYISGVTMSSMQKTYLLNLLRNAFANPYSTRISCSTLSVVIASARNASPSVLPPDKAARILADAARIKAVLSCP